MFGHLMQRTDSLEKTLLLGKIECGRRMGRQDEMVGWHHRLDEHKFEQAPVVGNGQGSLACCSPWGHKELHTTEQLTWTLILKSSITFYMKQSLLSMAFMEISKEVVTPKFLLKVFWNLDAILILFTLSILILKSL